MQIKALGLNGTLKSSSETSSTQKLLDQLLQRLGDFGVETNSVRLADRHIPPGVKADEGEGDQWPDIRRQMMDAQILVLATPIWVGQPSSLIKRAIERMDAFLDEIDEDGYYPTFGKVGIVAVVGNEDGAHHVAAELYQSLADFGFTIPGGSNAYWVGEAMGSKNYVDLDKTPDKLVEAIDTLACNAAHLAHVLAKSPYPHVPKGGKSK
ncbi:NAD(P)H-dependent oxidoreductase [Dyella jejuensis]|uniref:NAD(P)H-dependent oxidoreductase n=1 Tax=Dyella jejuensis TaxID=1432009 RepID=A0ABW8JHV7_9GAMM